MSAENKKPSARILLVDDEKSLRETLRRILEEDGDLHVETCGDGNAALEVFRSGDFDAVVTDNNMPGEMSGVELLKEIQELVQRGRQGVVVTVLMTGKAEAAKDEMKKLDVTVDLFFDKTTSKHLGLEIRGKLRELLGLENK